MGSQPSAEFKAAEAPTPIEALKLTLESKPHRDALKKMLDDNHEVKQQAVEIVGSEEKLYSVFEEAPENSYKTLMEILEQETQKEK